MEVHIRLLAQQADGAMSVRLGSSCVPKRDLPVKADRSVYLMGSVATAKRHTEQPTLFDNSRLPLSVSVAGR